MTEEIKTKVCSKCKLELELGLFPKCKAKKDGLNIYCKKCCVKSTTESRRIRSIKNKTLSDSWLERNNREVFFIMMTENTKEKIKKIKELDAFLFNSSLKIISENKRYQNNIKKLLSQNKTKEANRIKNKQRHECGYFRNYQKQRRDNDACFYLKDKVRKYIHSSLKRGGYTKKSRTHEILGCDYETFAAHLEAQFVDGMNWDNRDKWHIDHIIPLASTQTEEDVLRLNHYSNLQPLWAEDNLAKSDKMPPVQIQQSVKRNHAKLAGVHATLKQQSVFDLVMN